MGSKADLVIFQATIHISPFVFDWILFWVGKEGIVHQKKSCSADLKRKRHFILEQRIRFFFYIASLEVFGGFSWGDGGGVFGFAIIQHIKVLLM